MDCVKFWAVIFAAGALLYLSLFFIIKYQYQFYKYKGKEGDQEHSEIAVLVASIFYFVMTVLFILWGYVRDQRRNKVREIYANLPGVAISNDFQDKQIGGSKYNPPL